MGSIIGFGGWNQFYYYFILSTITKFIKQDIIVENSTQLSLDLKISNHRIMILLLGYISELFFGLLIYLFTLYLEHRRKKKKNLILSSQGIEHKQKSTLDYVIEMKNITLTNIEKIKNEISDNDKENDTGKASNIQNARQISLIHNDLEENISENTFQYISLSSSLIVTKEFLNQIIYSTNDIFDYYFLNLIILTLILKFWFKENIYRHRMLAVIMVTTVSLICFINCLLINNYSNNDEKRTILDIFDGKVYKIVILIILYLVLSFCFCVGILIQKNLMEYKFISPFKIIFNKGIIGIIAASLGLIITTKFKCNEKLSKDNEDIKEMKFFEFFVCSDEYNGTYYDNFKSYFNSFDNGKTKEGFLLFFYSILHFFTEIFLIFINKYLSPTHYLIAESLYSLIHIPFNYLSSASYDEIKETLNNGEKVKIESIYNAVIHTFGNRILKFIECFFDFIGF